MDLYLAPEELRELKKLIHQKLISITAEDWRQKHHMTYGSILLETDTSLLVLENDYRLVPYLGTQEELAGFAIHLATSKNDFINNLSPLSLVTEPIDEEILSIQIIRDHITVNFHDGHKELYSIDHAILLKLTHRELLVSLDFIYTPCSHIYLESSVQKYIKPPTYFLEDWKSDAEVVGESCNQEIIFSYTSTITREIIYLSTNS